MEAFEQARALRRAVERGDVVLLTTLLADGIDVDFVTRGGRSALHYAAWDGRVECLLALLSAGADVDVKNNNGSTPMQWALERNHTGCAVLLAAAGADPLPPPSCELPPPVAAAVVARLAALQPHAVAAARGRLAAIQSSGGAADADADVEAAAGPGAPKELLALLRAEAMKRGPRRRAAAAAIRAMQKLAAADFSPQRSEERGARGAPELVSIIAVARAAAEAGALAAAEAEAAAASVAAAEALEVARERQRALIKLRAELLSAQGPIIILNNEQQSQLA